MLTLNVDTALSSGRVFCPILAFGMYELVADTELRMCEKNRQIVMVEPIYHGM